MGEARCEQNVCHIQAHIMDGKLYLEETWILQDDGFVIEKAYQILNKVRADYRGSFELQESQE